MLRRTSPAVIMKAAIIFIASVLTNWALGQTPDSTTIPKTTKSFTTSYKEVSPVTGGFFYGRGQKRWFSKDHVRVETNRLQLTAIEDEISELESIECKALLKRDTAALKYIWVRDFTLDEPQNEILVSKNPIPHYLSLQRVIEKFIILEDEDVVYTSGYEIIGRLTSGGKTHQLTNRIFTHMWTKKFVGWRLSSKHYE